LRTVGLEAKVEEWVRYALSLDAEPPEGLRPPRWVAAKLGLTSRASKRPSR
jgi:hypothetical protein